MMKISDYRYTDSSKKINLDKLDTEADNGDSRSKYLEKAEKNIAEIIEYQEKLFAQKKEGLIIILQAMDAGGKDSTIKQVTSGINPAGVVVRDFKKPQSGDLEHDFMWRVFKMTPERGKIAIFNRSYYEDVLTVKVHKLHLKYNMMPRCLEDDSFFEKRQSHIRHFEQYIYDESYRIVKIFLHISKKEQKTRFLARLDEPDKNWKFDPGDLVDRDHFDEFQKTYEEVIQNTASDIAPWYIIPADNKWFSRYLVSQIILETLKEMDPQYPKLSEEELAKFVYYREILDKEDD